MSKSSKKDSESDGDWQEEKLGRLRALIKEADPEIVEERKWKKASNPDGVAVWSRDGMICTGEIYKDHIKLTFAKGASLKDPDHLFTQDGTVRRAIDFYVDDEINQPAFKKLVRSAVTLNSSAKKKK